MNAQANTRLDFLAIAGLAVGAAIGIGGSLMKDPILMAMFYELSSVGLTVAAVLLGLRYQAMGDLPVAAGFILLAIAEAVMSGGNAASSEGAQPAFGAGMALYVPAFILIAASNAFPMWVRVVGGLAAIPFLIAASKIFMGVPVPSTDPLPGAGYGLLTITIIGWIISTWKRTKAGAQQA